MAFFPAELLESSQENLLDVMSDIIQRGIKLLIDKNGNLARLLSIPLPQYNRFTKPSQQDFSNAVSDFWYHTLWSAKHLRRGELWWVKSCVDMYMKYLLQQMLERHAYARKGDQFDTWLRGRFLEEWADSRAVKHLVDTFAYYEVKDIACALIKTMDLYQWLEDETAAGWGYRIPRLGE
jgi:aminoglycoside 6-adenylyltransferase